MTPAIRSIKVALWLAALLALWLAHPTNLQAKRAFTCTEESFESHGKRILVDVYTPTSGKVITTALVLHGAGGMLFDGPAMARMARELTAHDICAYVVHYFDGSGVPFTSHDETLRRHHDEWLAVIRDAITWIEHPPGVLVLRPKGPFLAIYGYSMGAFLGIEASSDNPAVGALAEQAGGMWDNQPGRVGKMPPTLMLHGRDDRRVPFDKYAVPLEATLRKRGAPVRTIFYDHEGHTFTPAAQAWARGAVAMFIEQTFRSVNPALRGTKPVRREGRRTNLP